MRVVDENVRIRSGDFCKVIFLVKFNDHHIRQIDSEKFPDLVFIKRRMDEKRDLMLSTQMCGKRRGTSLPAATGGKVEIVDRNLHATGGA